MTSLCLHTCNSMLAIRQHVDKGQFQNVDNILSAGRSRRDLWSHVQGPSGLGRDPGIFEDVKVWIYTYFRHLHKYQLFKKKKKKNIPNTHQVHFSIIKPRPSGTNNRYGCTNKRYSPTTGSGFQSQYGWMAFLHRHSIMSVPNSFR